MNIRCVITLNPSLAQCIDGHPCISFPDFFTSERNPQGVNPLAFERAVNYGKKYEQLRARTDVYVVSYKLPGVARVTKPPPCRSLRKQK